MHEEVVRIVEDALSRINLEIDGRKHALTLRDIVVSEEERKSEPVSVVLRRVASADSTAFDGADVMTYVVTVFSGTREHMRLVETALYGILKEEVAWTATLAEQTYIEPIKSYAGDILLIIGY